MNKAWLVLSSLALVAWYTIVHPRRPPDAIEISALVLPALPDDSLAVVSLHIVNNRRANPLLVLQCGYTVRLDVERRVQGTWLLQRHLPESCEGRTVDLRAVPTSRLLAYRLELRAAGEYRVTFYHTASHANRAIPMQSRVFVIPERPVHNDAAT